MKHDPAIIAATETETGMAHRNVILSDGLPALIGGFTAAAAAGLTIVPSITVGAGVAAAYAIARKINQPA